MLPRLTSRWRAPSRLLVAASSGPTRPWSTTPAQRRPLESRDPGAEPRPPPPPPPPIRQAPRSDVGLVQRRFHGANMVPADSMSEAEFDTWWDGRAAEEQGASPTATTTTPADVLDALRAASTTGRPVGDDDAAQHQHQQQPTVADLTQRMMRLTPAEYSEPPAPGRRAADGARAVRVEVLARLAGRAEEGGEEGRAHWTVGALLEDPDHNIWAMRDRTGCEIELVTRVREDAELPQPAGGGSGLRDPEAAWHGMGARPTRTAGLPADGLRCVDVLVRGGRAAATRAVRELANLAELARLAEQDPAPGEQAVVRVRARLPHSFRGRPPNVFRLADTSSPRPPPPRLADEAPVPPVWTRRSLYAYVLALTDGSASSPSRNRCLPPQAASSAPYQTAAVRGRAHRDTVAALLASLFSDRDAGPHLSSAALDAALRWLQRRDVGGPGGVLTRPAARSLFYRAVVEAGVPPGAGTFNTLLAGAATAGDAKGFASVLEKMAWFGVAADNQTWETLLLLVATQGEYNVRRGLKSDGGEGGDEARTTPQLSRFEDVRRQMAEVIATMRTLGLLQRMATVQSVCTTAATVDAEAAIEEHGRRCEEHVAHERDRLAREERRRRREQPAVTTPAPTEPPTPPPSWDTMGFLADQERRYFSGAAEQTAAITAQHRWLRRARGNQLLKVLARRGHLAAAADLFRLMAGEVVPADDAARRRALAATADGIDVRGLHVLIRACGPRAEWLLQPEGADAAEVGLKLASSPPPQAMPSASPSASSLLQHDAQVDFLLSALGVATAFSDRQRRDAARTEDLDPSSPFHTARRRRRASPVAHCPPFVPVAATYRLLLDVFLPDHRADAAAAAALPTSHHPRAAAAVFRAAARSASLDWPARVKIGRLVWALWALTRKRDAAAALALEQDRGGATTDEETSEHEHEDEEAARLTRRLGRAMFVDQPRLPPRRKEPQQQELEQGGRKPPVVPWWPAARRDVFALLDREALHALAGLPASESPSPSSSSAAAATDPPPVLTDSPPPPQTDDTRRPAADDDTTHVAPSVLPTPPPLSPSASPPPPLLLLPADDARLPYQARGLLAKVGETVALAYRNFALASGWDGGNDERDLADLTADLHRAVRKDRRERGWQARKGRNGVKEPAEQLAHGPE